MPISTVSLTNTFDEWRIRTNQIVTAINTINESNSTFTGTLTITNPSSFQGNVSLNVASGLIKGDGGLLVNLQSSVVAAGAYEVANAAFNAANTAPNSSRVNTIFTVANAAFNRANLSSAVEVSATAPSGPISGDLWWNSNYGKLLLYYNDGNSSQWVDTNPGSDAFIDPVYDLANAAFNRANAGFTVSNSGYTVANAGFTVANAGYTVANAVYTISNASYTVANAAFAAANSALAGGATLSNQTASSNTFYPVFTETTSGTMSVANVATTKLYFVPSTGTLSATVFNSLSDSSLKNNVSPIDNALDIINNLSGVGFDWKDSGKHSFGVLAQDMEKVIPDLVNDINNLKHVNYDGIIAFLIEAIKQLNNKLENRE